MATDAETVPSGFAPTRAWRGLLLVCAAGVVWGTIGPAVQLVRESSGLSPWTISAYRAVAAVATLVVAAILTRRLPVCLELARCHLRRVAITGLATASFQLLFFIAVIATGVSVATVIALGLTPVLLLMAVGVRHRRSPAPREVLTVTTALVGLLLVCTAGGTGNDGPHPMLGIVAALGSATAYAVATHVGATLSRGHDALAVTTVTTTVAAGVLIPGGLIAGFLRGEPLGITGTASWFYLAYLGVVTMAFAYVLLYAGLKSTSSGSAVVATLLEPVTAVGIAVLVLGERPTGLVLAGTVLILAAIATLGREVDTEPQPQ